MSVKKLLGKKQDSEGGAAAGDAAGGDRQTILSVLFSQKIKRISEVGKHQLVVQLLSSSLQLGEGFLTS